MYVQLCLRVSEREYSVCVSQCVCVCTCKDGLTVAINFQIQIGQ